MTKTWILTALPALALAVASADARAGRFEVSSGFSFSKSNYGDGNITWMRRWGASLGYHFSERSEFEISFQDVVNRTKIAGYEDTTFHDQIYSANWVQSLLGRDYLVDPYFKVGIGQLNRDASGSYATGGSPVSQVDSVTGILGAGLRIHLSRAFGLRGEVNTYLAGGRLNTWQDNVAANFGFSIFY